MSARTDLLRSTHEYPRNCFADISVDREEFGCWQYRNELRRQDAASSLPMIDADVLPEGFRPRVRHEVSRKASKLLGEILCHFFPSHFFVAKTARGKSGNELTQVASEFVSHPTKCGHAKVPVLERDRFATGARA